MKNFIKKNLFRPIDSGAKMMYNLRVNKDKERYKTMKKMTFTNNLQFEYDGTRKGAKYTLNGGKNWMNHGEYSECLAKSVLGYEAEKDANTAFNMGHDIPEIGASVKSHNCGLTDMKLADNKADFIERFFEMSDPQTTYIWVYDYADMVDIWFMDTEEFKAFTNQFGSWDGYAKKIRFKTCNNKINAWLEEQIA